MNKNYLIRALYVILITVTTIVNTNAFAHVIGQDSSKYKLKLKDNRPNRPKYESIINKDFESFMLRVSAIKSSSTAKTETKSTNNIDKKNAIISNIETSKTLDKVRIYPNPVATFLNLSYTLAKDNTVTIKILDILGNDVATLLSQKVNAGEQVNSFNLNSKLNSGLYFVKISTGSESIIKRISIL